MLKTLLYAAVAGTCIISASGCGTIATEAYHKYTGPEGLFVETQPVGTSRDHFALSRYTHYELGDFKDNFAGRVPLEFFADMKSEFPTQLRKAKLMDMPGGKTLLVRGTVLFYEHAGTWGYVMGDIEQVVARVELVDKESGKVLGTAMCLGRTTTRTNQGVKYKAQGMDKATAEWIAQYSPLHEE